MFISRPTSEWNNGRTPKQGWGTWFDSHNLERLSLWRVIIRTIAGEQEWYVLAGYSEEAIVSAKNATIGLSFENQEYKIDIQDYCQIEAKSIELIAESWGIVCRALK